MEEWRNRRPNLHIPQSPNKVSTRTILIRWDYERARFHGFLMWIENVYRSAAVALLLNIFANAFRI